MYKSSIGDYPLKVHPCKYWFVRYAVACTYFTDKQAEMIDAYRKHIGLPQYRAYAGSYDDREIWLNGVEEKDKLDPESELYKRINVFIRDYEDPLDNNEKIQWINCPFQEHDQSACPFYEPDPFYKDVPLEKLREMKGYEV